MPAFVLTWLIESIVYLWAFSSLGWLAARSSSAATSTPRPGLVQVLGLALVVNLATHPLLWAFTTAFPGVGALVAAEVVAVAVEGSIVAAVFSRRVPNAVQRWTWSGLAALLANAVSLLIGLVAMGPLFSGLGGGPWACC